MRFTIKTLLAIICLVALTIGAATKLRSTSALRANEATLLVQIAGGNQAMLQAIKSGDDLGFERRTELLVAQVEQQRALTTRLADSFLAKVRETKPDPIPGLVAVLERMAIERPNVYQKAWAIYVPKQQHAAMQVDFVDQNNSTSNLPIEIVDQHAGRWPLRTGSNEVIAAFNSQDADFELTINEIVVARFECSNKKITGRSVQNHTSPTQLDIDISSHSQLKLVVITPHPGTVGFRVSLVEDVSK